MPLPIKVSLVHAVSDVAVLVSVKMLELGLPNHMPERMTLVADEIVNSL